MQPESIRLPGAHGLELHALVWSSEGTPLLFIHGFGNDCHVWDESAPLVAPHYRTLAIDLPGHGGSDSDPEQRYDPASLAESVVRALDALAIERVVLVGHSLGGRTAMHCACERPERVAGLVVVDSAPEHDSRGSERIRSEASTAPLIFNSVREYERMLIDLYPAATPATMARMAQHWLRERPDGKFEPRLDPSFRGGAEAIRSEQELLELAEQQTQYLWKQLPKLECPALVVRGAASDVLSPEIADRLADETFRAGSLVTIPAASHSVMLDNPEGFNESAHGVRAGLGQWRDYSAPTSLHGRVWEVAPDLLGRLLVHCDRGQKRVGRIVEVEAYLGDGSDPGRALAPGGPLRATGACSVPPGGFYVYRSMGMHFCVNLVCEQAGSGAAVLLRAVEPLEGLARMRRLRAGRADRELASGPGKLTPRVRDRSSARRSGGAARATAHRGRRAAAPVGRCVPAPASASAAPLPCPIASSTRVARASAAHH